MTKEQYLMMCEQTNQEIDWEKCPPEWEDFPNIVIESMNLYNSLGNKVYPDVGFTGKDYTNFEFLYNFQGFHEHQKEFVFELLFELESRDIERSQRRLKAEYDRIKKK
tara:strand:- start:44 stop:367 length:324 start_codon:yes stop_codon:yes gene_type:complete